MASSSLSFLHSWNCLARFGGGLLVVALAGCGQPGGSGIALNNVVDRGEMVMAGVPEIRPAVRERMLQYLNVRSAGFVDSDDEGQPLSRMLVRTRFGNSAQLHEVTMPGGARRQITFYDEPVGSAVYIPGSGGRRILFLRDVGGGEDYQLYELDLATSQTTMRTEGKGQHGSLTLSVDGSKAAYYSTARNGKDYDTFVLELAAGSTPKLVYQGTGAISPLGFSPDGAKLLMGDFKSVSESAIQLLDIASGSLTPVTPAGEKVANGDAVFSADGRHIFYTSDRNSEYRRLIRRDAVSGSETVLTSNLNWDVEGVAVSPKGNAVVFVTNEDGVSRLYRLDSAEGATYSPVAMPGEGILSGLTFNRAGTHLCYSFGSASLPGDVFTLKVDELSGSAQPTRWTFSEAGGLSEERMVAPTRIAFETFDSVNGVKRTIPAYYYRPQGNGPFPVVINIHGGPEGQSRPAFSGFVQYLVCEMKVAVIAPNVRGSTGYGRSFHQLDNGMLREDSVKDIGQLLVWIKLQPELDAGRVAVYGGSYGGYMVLACLTNYPQFIKAGIDVVGIANFVSFLERTRDYRRDLRRAEYGDERDPEMRKHLTKISPLNNADRIRSALFVVHGQNDPRVPLFEAEQIVQKQQQAGRKVWYLMAKGEGHGFRKRSNSDVAQVLYAMFFEENLVK